MKQTGLANPRPIQIAGENPMHITVHLLICAGREAALDATLANWARTDWPGPPAIHRAEHLPADPLRSTERGFLHLLARALAGPGNHFLLIEDDLRFHLRLHRQLLHWSLWQHLAKTGAPLHYAHLYNPQLRPAEPPADGPTWFAALPRSVIGSQARLFSRAFAGHVLARFHGPGPIHDRRIAALAAAQGPIYIHRPSLIQHAGVPSTWGGPAHTAWDFDENWRAE